MASERRTIPVHALGDERVHLAPPHHGRLRQGRLKTLCDKQAVSELPLFTSIEPKSRCRTCFGKVDEHGYLKEDEAAEAAPAARKSKASAEVITLPAKRRRHGAE